MDGGNRGKCGWGVGGQKIEVPLVHVPVNGWNDGNVGIAKLLKVQGGP